MKHHTSEDTLQQNTPSLKMGANVQSPPRLQRVMQWHPPWGASNFTLFTIKALHRCVTTAQLTKYGRVDGNPTGLFRTHRGAKHSGHQTQWHTPTHTFGNKQVRSINVGGRYNARLFKLSRPEKAGNFQKKKKNPLYW